jgi:hypothetical protein
LAGIFFPINKARAPRLQRYSQRWRMAPQRLLLPLVLLPLLRHAASPAPPVAPLVPTDESWVEQLAGRAFCENPWLMAPSVEGATLSVCAGVGGSARGLPEDAVANVEQLLASVGPFYQTLFRKAMGIPTFTYNATAQATSVVRFAAEAYAAHGSTVPGLTVDEAVAVACWSLDCFIAENVCLRAGFPFGLRRQTGVGEDNNRDAWHALQSWAPAGCGRTTKLLGWLHSALRKLGAPGSSYAIPLTARSLGRCLRLDDIRPGAKSLP